MKIGARVITTFDESDNLDPSVGIVVEQMHRRGKGLIVKVRGDDGVDNWYPVNWVSPLIRAVK